MGYRTIKVSSRALGPRLCVTVKVYDTVQEMRKAGDAYNGIEHPDALGLTQVTTDETGRVVCVTVRLVRGHLGTGVVVHEIHHAATALYGSQVGDRVSRSAHLNHFNEPFAYLQSDLTVRLVDRLYDLGYYSSR